LATSYLWKSYSILIKMEGGQNVSRLKIFLLSLNPAPLNTSFKHIVIWQFGILKKSCIYCSIDSFLFEFNLPSKLFTLQNCAINASSKQFFKFNSHLKSRQIKKETIDILLINSNSNNGN